MNKNTFLFTFRKAKTDVYSLIIITTTITLTIYHYMKQRRSATLRVKSSKGIVWSFFFFFLDIIQASELPLIIFYLYLSD